MTKKGEEEQELTINHVYVRDDSNGGCWVPALQLLVHNGQAKVTIPDFKNEQEMLQCGKPGGAQRYKNNQFIDLKDYPNYVLPMANVDGNGRLEEYKDMVGLPFLHEVSSCWHL